MYSRITIVTLATAALLFPLPVAGQIPDQLKHSIPAPFGAAQSGGNLGASVAADAVYSVVGALMDNLGAFDTGVVKVINTTTGAFLFVLRNPHPVAGDDFGSAVAISGTRVVVGVNGSDSSATDSGRAYVYDLSSGTPASPILTLDNPSPATDDRFGVSVAISGTRIVVGALRDDTGATDAGSAYVYDVTRRPLCR